MNWTPLEEAQLATLIADAVALMEPSARSLWKLVHVWPVKWQLHPWGDEGGGFWIVGIIGQNVIWYNDIEHGFNISRYEVLGDIAEYWCNQDELNHTMHALQKQIENGEGPCKLGPPEPLT
jgi:hypothetical protein